MFPFYWINFISLWNIKSTFKLNYTSPFLEKSLFLRLLYGERLTCVGGSLSMSNNSLFILLRAIFKSFFQFFSWRVGKGVELIWCNKCDSDIVSHFLTQRSKVVRAEQTNSYQRNRYRNFSQSVWGTSTKIGYHWYCIKFISWCRKWRCQLAKRYGIDTGSTSGFKPNN